MKAYEAETSCNWLFIDTATYIIAHSQFAYIKINDPSNSTS